MNTASRITLSTRQRIAAAWQGFTLRERRLLILGSTTLLVLLCWFWVIDPAIKTRKKMQQQLPELRAQSVQLRALAQEVAALPPAAPVKQSSSREELERSLMDSGLTAEKITLSDGRFILSFSDVPFSTLTDFLQKAQREHQMAVTEATITARDRIDRVDAKLSLQRPS
jgi:type II secretory pathway component PulM